MTDDQIHTLRIDSENNRILFSQAMSGEDSTFWYDAIKEKMESMAKNQVWDLIKLPNEATTISYI